MWDVVLFYKYTPIDNVPEMVATHEALATRLGLSGRLLIAPEGVNGTLACEAATFTAAGDLAGSELTSKTSSEDFSKTGLAQYLEVLRSDPRFEGVDLKLSSSPKAPFPDLSVRDVPEIVGYGKALAGIEDPAGEAGRHLSPEEFHAAVLQAQTSDDFLLLDVRNGFEYEIGHFDSAVHPSMRVTSEFAPWVKKNAADFEGKKVLMYCTGGVRCEKASAFLLREELSGARPLQVSQLSGGIHRYLEAFPDGGLFKGKNFVFDARVTMTAADHAPAKADEAKADEATGAPSAAKRPKTEPKASNPSQALQGGGDGLQGASPLSVVGRCGFQVSGCGAGWDEPRPIDVCAVCKAVCLVCRKCREQNAELLCPTHAPWLRGLYFWFLEPFGLPELERQRRGLATLLAQAQAQAQAQQAQGKQAQGKADSRGPREGASGAKKGLAPAEGSGAEKGAGLSKRQRQTVRKQLARVDARIQALGKQGKQAPDERGQGPACPRRCRWCELELTREWQVGDTAQSEAASSPSGAAEAKGVTLCDGRCWGFWRAPTRGLGGQDRDSGVVG